MHFHCARAAAGGGGATSRAGKNVGVLRDLCGALEPPNGSPEWELQLRQRPARRRPAPGTVQVPISGAIGLGPGAAPRPSTVWEAGSLTANVLGKWAGELFVRPCFGGAPRTSFAATHTHTQLLWYSTVLARSLGTPFLACMTNLARRVRPNAHPGAVSGRGATSLPSGAQPSRRH